MAQAMDGDMQIAGGRLQGEIGPEKFDKLVGRAELPGVEQEPFEQDPDLAAPPHGLFDGLPLAE